MTLLKSKTPHPKKFRHRLLIIALLCLSVSILLLTLAGKTASSEEGLRIGSTTYTAEFDRDDTYQEWFDFRVSRNPTFIYRRLLVGFPFGLLTVESYYNPGDAIREFLPRDVPSLIKHLAARDRFEVKVAAELLEDHKPSAVPALPALFAAWDRNYDLQLDDQIRSIALAAPHDSVEPLILALSATDSRVRTYSAHLLGVFGTNALRAAPALRAAFETNTTDKARFAHAYFKITGECSDMIPKLREILKSGEPDDKLYALLLIKSAGTLAVAALPEVFGIILAEQPSDLDCLAVLALSRISDDKQTVLEHALRAINSTNEVHLNSRSSAISALANLGTLGLPHLIPLYKDQHNGSHYDAGRAFIAMGPAAAPYLDDFRIDLKSLDSTRVQLACEIISSLGTNSVRAVPEVSSLLQSQSSETRACAAAALIRLGHFDDATIELLVFECAAPFGSASLGFSFRTLVDLLITNDSARAIVRKRFANDPLAAQRFDEMIESWQTAKSWGGEILQYRSPSEMAVFSRLFGPAPDE